MNLIETDRVGLGFITQRHHDADISSARETTAGKTVIKHSDSQLQSLMSLINQSAAPIAHQQHLEQLKIAVQASEYVIDFDALTHNLLAADHEL